MVGFIVIKRTNFTFNINKTLFFHFDYVDYVYSHHVSPESVIIYVDVFMCCTRASPITFQRVI